MKSVQRNASDNDNHNKKKSITTNSLNAKPQISGVVSGKDKGPSTDEYCASEVCDSVEVQI
eukprot:m.120388 g.120388  ORF g.120388 m.120388 type:complete len:61 (-) comp23231_c0_seq3:4381-4563(-)